jgi:hypothetical protein
MPSPWKIETKVVHERKTFSEETNRNFDRVCKIVSELLKYEKHDALSIAATTLAMILRHLTPKDDFKERVEGALEMVRKMINLSPDKLPIEIIQLLEEDKSDKDTTLAG